MNPNAKRVLTGAIIIALVATVLGWFAANFSDNAATVFCNDLKSMQSFAATASDHEKRDMEQQIAACKGVDLDNPLADEIPNSGSSASPSASATATPQAQPKEKHWYDPFDPSAEQFYANWPATYKNSANAFGPNKPLAPSLQGKEMEKLNADQAYTEHEYVIERDRMQTSSAMVALGLTDKNVNELTRAYVKDAKLWEHDRKVVKKKLSDMDRRVEDTKAGTKTTTLRALPGNGDDTPIVDSIGVTYPDTTRWVVYTDSNGKDYWFRLICKFQPRLFAETKQVPQAPPTREGITRTHEGTPVPLVDACRKVNGKWKNVYKVTRKAGDLPVNSPKCKPSSTSTPTPTTPTTPPNTPTPTPTPTTPPNTPTPTPTPTPSETCPPGTVYDEPTGECINVKDDEDSPDAPIDRDPAPAPNPDEGEDTPHPDPDEPADPGTAPGSGTDDPAPGSTPAPSQSAPAPVVTNAPSTPSDNDDDPDN